MIPVTYGYVRVSKQALEGRNLDTQVRILQEYGIRDELIFRDVGTGRNTNRPGWQTLMGQIQPGDTLVVCWMDRISRDFGGSVAIQTDFAERGIGIVACEEDIDTRRKGTAGDHFLQRIMLAEGAYQAESTSERIRAGIERARASGKKVGRPETLSPHQKELALRLRLEGKSWRYLARLFDCHRETVKRALAGMMEESKL